MGNQNYYIFCWRLGRFLIFLNGFVSPFWFETSTSDYSLLYFIILVGATASSEPGDQAAPPQPPVATDIVPALNVDPGAHGPEEASAQVASEMYVDSTSARNVPKEHWMNTLTPTKAWEKNQYFRRNIGFARDCAKRIGKLVGQSLEVSLLLPLLLSIMFPLTLLLLFLFSRQFNKYEVD